ncbi:hypothetical protein [Paenibacillus sp. FSL R7-0128]|uniref:hypothetical protein n=1 Tax=Paenibacillus sp. FSL R7-0128 TaxID=2954529 RepID=UPI0030F56A68
MGEESLRAHIVFGALATVLYESFEVNPRELLTEEEDTFIQTYLSGMDDGDTSANELATRLATELFREHLTKFMALACPEGGGSDRKEDGVSETDTAGN